MGLDYTDRLVRLHLMLFNHSFYKVTKMAEAIENSPQTQNHRAKNNVENCMRNKHCA